MVEATPYNLRSTRRDEVNIPMQIELVDDEGFITQSLWSSHHSARKVPCFDNSGSTSDSDLDLSELLKYYDSMVSYKKKAPQRSFLVCILIKTHVAKNRHAKQEVSCFSTLLLLAWPIRISLLLMLRLIAEKLNKKRVNLGMSLFTKKHVHKSRLVFNSNHKHSDIMSLQSMPRDELNICLALALHM